MPLALRTLGVISDGLSGLTATSRKDLRARSGNSILFLSRAVFVERKARKGGLQCR
jgi:hypothetical protein